MKVLIMIVEMIVRICTRRVQFIKMMFSNLKLMALL